MAEVEVVSDLNANVWKLQTTVGDRVDLDQELAILESMKMEIPVTAPTAGRVSRILVAETEAVREGQVLMILET